MINAFLSDSRPESHRRRLRSIRRSRFALRLADYLVLRLTHDLALRLALRLADCFAVSRFPSLFEKLGLASELVYAA